MLWLRETKAGKRPSACWSRRSGLLQDLIPSALAPTGTCWEAPQWL